nr:PR domain zinc finger protein 15-like [Cherax quadricarinatus]
MSEGTRIAVRRAEEGSKMEEAGLLPGTPVVCLVCDRIIKTITGQEVHNIFLESSVTSHTQQQLGNMIEQIIKSPLNASQVYSKTLCRRCFRLLDELDEIQQRSDNIKTTIAGWYNRSFLRRLKLPDGTEESIESMEIDSPVEEDESNVTLKDEPLDEDDDLLGEELRPEDQGIRPDDPEFNPAYDNVWMMGKARARGRGRYIDVFPKPEIVQKILNYHKFQVKKAKQVSPISQSSLLTQGLFTGDENTEEQPGLGAEDSATAAATETDEPTASTDEKLDKTLQVTRPREPGKRVPVLSERMRLSLAELSRKSRALPQIDTYGTLKKEARSRGTNSEERVKRQYRKRSHIIHLCKFCMKVCPTGEQLKEHQRTHDTIECQFCGKVLARIGAWENHLKDFHNVEIQVPGNEDALNRPKDEVDCSVCGKQFSSKSALAYHSKLHDGKSYHCDKCLKVFTHPSNLKTHQLRHEKKRYYCDKCGKKFHTNFALLMHDNQTHRMAKSWKCKHCSKAFTRCAAFKEHIRIHTGEKPFECHICGVKFRKIHHLKNHAKQHEPKKFRSGPFKCQLCPSAVFLHKVSYDHHRKFKHPEVEMSTLIGGESDVFSSKIVLKREYVIESRGEKVSTSYMVGDFKEGEGIEMVGLDDAIFGVGGQCIIVLSEASEDDTKNQVLLPQIEMSSVTADATPIIETDFLKEEIDDIEGNSDDEVSKFQEFDAVQLASLQEQIQLSEQMTATQLQQISMAALESGKFQVQMDGETFDVYTVAPSE